MSSIDLFKDFNDDDDARYGDDDDDDIDRDNQNNENGQESDNKNAGSDNEGRQEVDPAIKIKKAKRKLVTLNAERLKGPRGIIAIDDFFKNIKLKGKGYEKDDLNEVMKRLEHWSHRMFPKYHFDDSLAKIEMLGRKKEIATHMSRYRLGQLTQEDENQVLSDVEDDRMEDTLAHELPVDEFEDMLNQQIALTSTTHRSNNDASVSQLNMSSVSTSTQIHNKPMTQEPETPLFSQPSQVEFTQTKPQLTDEQKARIEENRKRAMAIRAAKMKEMEEKRLKEAEELKLKEQSQPTINIEIDDDFC
ncbi:protein TIPIN homolog [Chironomus tepperi]|uniref:protein TIPIN homolog n=1 Tax=Chironomus tepperi TaxID=113505 RepID=UPI00391FC5C1